MEPSETAPSAASSWTSVTNWTVAGGSVDNSVTFESSLSLIDDLDNDSLDQSTVGDANLRSPLILYPPSPDSSSCEITLTFAQKHEVRQVYVRSTARVFEIYCDPDSENSGEYLCTVRGCVAVRDEEVLRVTNIEEAVLVHQMGSNKELAGDKTKIGASPTASEDDWVDVKVPCASPSFEKTRSMSSSSDTDGGCTSQDLYEATAEISDTNPCKSLKIRLLSLQNKGCVCIHEVYVFAEPVDESTLENQAVPMGNSSGSSLMTMLLPTLFQLSKTQGIGRDQDKHNVDTVGQMSVEASSISTDEIGARNISKEELVPSDTHSLEHKSVEVSSLTSDSISTHREVLHEGKDLLPFGERSGVPDAAHVSVPASVSETDYKGASSENCIGSVLDHLLSRVNRIEDLFLRFEDRIMKPIISIDERLQQVEQHLEVITKKTCNLGTRISAPEFCYSESESNSFYNSGSLDLSYTACEATKKDPTMVMSSIPPDVTSLSESKTLPQLSLLASVPAFDNAKDEKNLAVESVQETQKLEQKHSVSIDYALASAFAGFLSSTSSECHTYSPILAVRAPDFPNEDENENDDNQTSSSSMQSEITTDPQDSDEIEGLPKLHPEETTEARDLTTSVTSFPCSKNVTGLVNLEELLKAERAANGQCQNGEAHEDDANNVALAHLAAQENDAVGGVDSHLVLEDIEKGEANDYSTSNAAILEQTEIFKESSEDQTDGNFNDPPHILDSTLVAEPNLSQEELKSVIQLSRTSSAVDYDNPILEVKFITEERLDAGSPLQALLSSFGDHVEAPSTHVESDNNMSSLDSHGDLIPVEDWEAANSPTMDSRSFIDTNYCSLGDVNVNTEAIDKPDDSVLCSNQEGSTTSLI